MLYIAGDKDTLEGLWIEQGLTCSFDEYKKRFLSLNPHMHSVTKIPPYSMLNLSTDDEQADRIVMREHAPLVVDLSIGQRRIVKELEEEKQDLLTQLGAYEVLKNLQEYAIQFTNFYNSPMFNSPWEFMNQSLPMSSAIDIFAGVSGFVFRRASSLAIYAKAHEDLYDHMMKRDVLNRELYLLPKNAKNAPLRRKLELEVRKHSARIKELFPKCIDGVVKSCLSKKYTPEKIAQLSSNAYSKKMARKGRLVTTTLGFLNSIGLKRLRSFLKHVETFGKWGNRAAFWLGPAAVGFDVMGAHHSKNRSAMRAFLTGTAGLSVGIGLGSLFTLSEFGSLLMGTACGAAFGIPAAGSVLLINSPILGWIALGTIGLVAAGYLSYQASEIVGYVWDYRHEIADQATALYRSVERKIVSIWDSSHTYFRKLYGAQEPARQ